MFVISFGFNAPIKATGSPGPADLLKVDSIYQSARLAFQQYATEFYTELGEDQIDYTMFVQGLTGYLNLEKRGKLGRSGILTLIDFSKPSSEPRLYIIDMCERRLIYESIVTHGQKSGGLIPRHFSNEENSHQSSLGFYVTGTTYSGKYDLALRLNGMEHSNSNASSRGVVMHAAKYATYEFLEKNGCVLGRSYGCPAMPFDNFDKVVGWIKEGTALYAYYPNRSYKRYSRYLNRRNYLEEFVKV